MKYSSDTIGNRTRDHLACSAVPLLKAVNNLYVTVDDYGYDYMHIFMIGTCIVMSSYYVDQQNSSLFNLIKFNLTN